MKKILLPLFSLLLLSNFLLAQTPTKPKHLLPNGEPDRPFTFFVKHGFSCYTDAATRTPFESRPAYNFGGGVRVEDDDKDSPAFLELEGMYCKAGGGDGLLNKVFLKDENIYLSFYFVLLNNSTKSFRWNAGTGVGWNSIQDNYILKGTNQIGFNFATQSEMLLKHKRFNVFANYHLLPFIQSGWEKYNFNTLSLGMGFYFR